MNGSETYSTSRGVENAIKDAAARRVSSDPSLDVSKRIRLEYFNRFLSRIFSDGPESDWILKGGTGMLARVPSTRATRDIDLSIHGFSLREALTDLIRLSEIDLGDHFRFEYIGHTETIADAKQPYVQGYRVRFSIFIGVAPKGKLQIDLVVGNEITGEVTSIRPASALPLPRLVSYPYRIYPVVDQIADKVCATMTEFQRGDSSREKDLVDLVVLATSQDIDGLALQRAIFVEARRRQMDLAESFTIPAWWGKGYTKLAKTVPHCAAYQTVDLAVAIVSRCLDPVLSNNAAGWSWDHAVLKWV